MSAHNTVGKARYIMIGGFLGAGKTTAVGRLAKEMTDRGFKVGLITNDQGSELVDTATLRSKGFAVEQIPGGCFCCRFNSLTEAAQKLTDASRPDVFIAEPVGSCTDLVATVTHPLRRIYGEQYSIAPLSVLVDPVRALRIFGLEEGGKFSDKVVYIYRKQLAEADVIVINKTDILSEEQLSALREKLALEFPKAHIFAVSARNGAGTSDWFSAIASAEQLSRSVMDIDYDIYAEGEALLGWLNCTIDFEHPEGIDGNRLVKDLADNLHLFLEKQEAEVAHLKMTLSPSTGLGDIAVINLVRNDYVPELSQMLDEPVDKGQIIVNLRAEASPDVLRDGVESALRQVVNQNLGLRADVEHLEHFRPGKPQPTYRFTS